MKMTPEPSYHGAGEEDNSTVPVPQPEPTDKSHAIHVMVEREVGKLTRQSRMLIEDDPPEEEVVEESKYNENDDEVPLVTSREDSTPEVPLFDRKEILAGPLLGNGAFSEVYQITGFQLQDTDIQRDTRQHLAVTAMDTTTGQCAYVLKHLRGALRQDKSRFVHAASDLVMEALFLSKLNHPNVITLRGTSRGIDTFGDYDGFFLILDRLDCTLSDKIAHWARHTSCRRKVYSRNLYDYAEKIDIALQIARGLDYLHDRDILYRDLKPDNLGIQLIDGKQVVKIFDFGLCRELPEECPLENKVFHMSGVGTRRYMAPEIFLTQHYNLKVDVYSFAIVLHCMMSLVRPFEKYNAHLHTLLVCKEGVRPHIPHEWPKELQELLREGWAHQPSDRPSIKESRQRLERLVQRVEAEGIPHTASHSEPLLPHTYPQCQVTCWQPPIQQAGNFLRRIEQQMVKGMATSYIHRSNPKVPNREHADLRKHLRSVFL